MHVDSYRNDNEVQPTPGVGEILLEAVGGPLHHHFTHEYNAERLVHGLENYSQCLSFFDIDVFYRLKSVTYSTNTHAEKFSAISSFLNLRLAAEKSHRSMSLCIKNNQFKNRNIAHQF